MPNFVYDGDDLDCCPNCGFLLCPKHKAEFEAKHPPEPVPHKVPKRCLCGSEFKLIGKSTQDGHKMEHYECKSCSLPIDRWMA